MAMMVTSAVVAGLVHEAAIAHPAECCGLLFGIDGEITAYRPVANVHLTPETRFEIDPQPLIDAYRAMREGGPQLIGYYHSHPDGPPEPSATDRAMAADDRMIWAIVARNELRLWVTTSDGFSALSYAMV